MKGSYYKDKDLNLSEINFLEGANKIILNKGGKEKKSMKELDNKQEKIKII